MSVGPLIALRNPLILFFRAQNDNLKNKNLFGNEGKELEGWANQTIWCVEEKTKNGSPGRDRTCDMVIIDPQVLTKIFEMLEDLAKAK